MMNIQKAEYDAMPMGEMNELVACFRFAYMGMGIRQKQNIPYDEEVIPDIP